MKKKKIIVDSGEYREAQTSDGTWIVEDEFNALGFTPKDGWKLYPREIKEAKNADE